MTTAPDHGMILAPPGAYTVLVAESGDRWVIRSIRLYGQDIWADYEATHNLLANNHWGSVTVAFDTREDALAAGAEIAAEHRLLHAYWAPKE